MQFTIQRQELCRVYTTELSTCIRLSVIVTDSFTMDLTRRDCVIIRLCEKSSSY